MRSRRSELIEEARLERECVRIRDVCIEGAIIDVGVEKDCTTCRQVCYSDIKWLGKE